MQNESGSTGERIALKSNELGIEVEHVKKIIHPYIDGLDENTVKGHPGFFCFTPDGIQIVGRDPDTECRILFHLRPPFL